MGFSGDGEYVMGGELSAEDISRRIVLIEVVSIRRGGDEDFA